MKWHDKRDEPNYEPKIQRQYVLENSLANHTLYHHSEKVISLNHPDTAEQWDSRIKQSFSLGVKNKGKKGNMVCLSCPQFHFVDFSDMISIRGDFSFKIPFLLSPSDITSSCFWSTFFLPFWCLIKSLLYCGWIFTFEKHMGM